MLYQVQSFNSVIGRFEAVGEPDISPEQAAPLLASALGDKIGPFGTVAVTMDGELSRLVIPIWRPEYLEQVHNVMNLVVYDPSAFESIF